MAMASLSKELISTPIGNLIAVTSSKGLCLLNFEENSDFFQKRLAQYCPDYTFDNRYQDLLNRTKSWLNDYFLKKFKLLENLPLDLQGSPFSLQAWNALRMVPVHTTLSYGTLAKQIGAPKASRAIGKVVGENPIIIMIPCHRIVGSEGTLTGFSCGLERKEWLLTHEGHTIQKNNIPSRATLSV
jgi:methylated-DNA-[protein]-cysteine S-methyltransferase